MKQVTCSKVCKLAVMGHMFQIFALLTYFTSNIHEAYQRQINSQFFVTHPGIEPRTHCLKDERANEDQKEDFPIWSITPTHLYLRDITPSPTLDTSSCLINSQQPCTVGHSIQGGGVRPGVTKPKKPKGPPLPPNRNGPNVALPAYFTRNIHEAYQRQINSQFFVTKLGIEPGTHWLKDERASE